MEHDSAQLRKHRSGSTDNELTVHLNNYDNTLIACNRQVVIVELLKINLFSACGIPIYTRDRLSLQSLDCLPLSTGYPSEDNNKIFGFIFILKNQVFYLYLYNSIKSRQPTFNTITTRTKFFVQLECVR